MYETLLTKEECAKALDLEYFYRFPANNRNLYYDKYITDGKKAVTIEEFNSNNTFRLNKEEIKEAMYKLDYIKQRLAKYK